MSASLFGKQSGDLQPRILVVDDDRRVLELLDLALSTHGFRVLTAADGEEALKQALGQRPDLVVLDVRLPRKSGLEVCEALRRDPDENTVPIILVSAAIETETRLQAFARGADDYLAKPFSPKELIARVKRLLVRTAETREARRRMRELELQLARAQDDARRAHHEVRREQRMRELAFGLGSELHRTLDLDALGTRIVSAAQSRLGVGMAALLVRDARGAFVARAVRGDGWERVAGLELGSVGELAAMLEALARPLLRRDLERFPELIAELPPLVAGGIVLLAPLRGPERLEAVLIADERVDGAELPAVEVEALTGLCEIGAVALANAQRVRVQTEHALQRLAARESDVPAMERRAAAALLIDRAARAAMLPPRERELMLHGIALGAPASGTECALALEALEAADPTRRVADLRRLIARARAIADSVASAANGGSFPDESDPDERRAALLLAAGLGYAAARAEGLPPGEALDRAARDLGSALDPATRRALDQAGRDGRETADRAA